MRCDSLTKVKMKAVMVSDVVCVLEEFHSREALSFFLNKKGNRNKIVFYFIILLGNFLGYKTIPITSKSAS